MYNFFASVIFGHHIKCVEHVWYKYLCYSTAEFSILIWTAVVVMVSVVTACLKDKKYLQSLIW